MRKVPSAFIRTATPEEGALEYQGLRWKIGEVRSGTEYPLVLDDLVRLYPLVVKAFAKEGMENVAISLPAEAFHTALKRKKAGSENLIDKLTNSIKKETGIVPIIFPQGVIALVEIFADTGNNLSEEGNTLVIDGGFNTINVAIADREMNIKYVFTYYNELGIRDLLDVFASLLRERTNIELTANLQKLKEAFLAGKLSVGFQDIEVNGEKNVAVSMFIDKLWNRLTGDLTRTGVGFDQIAIVGGIAYYIKDFIKEKTTKPVFVPAQEAEFYTVKGMHRFSKLPSIDFGFGDIKLYGFDGE